MRVSFAVADPGFPVGWGAKPLGGANLQRGYFSAKMYSKTKELDPVVGGRTPAAPPVDPPMLCVCPCPAFPQRLMLHGQGLENLEKW